MNGEANMEEVSFEIEWSFLTKALLSKDRNRSGLKCSKQCNTCLDRVAFALAVNHSQKGILTYGVNIGCSTGGGHLEEALASIKEAILQRIDTDLSGT
jgi:hypothetical protein